MPDLTSVHIQRALNSLSIQLSNDPQVLVARRMCAVRQVENNADKFYQYNTDWGLKASPAGSSARAMLSSRVPGAEAAEIDYTLATNPYVVTKYSLRDYVSDEEIGQSDSPLSPLLDAAQNLAQRLALDMERVASRLLADASLYNASNKETLTTGGTGTSWKSLASANSDPFTQIRNARERIKKTMGVKPNTLILSGEAASYLADHPSIKNVAQYTDPTYLARAYSIPSPLKGLNIVIADGIYDTAAEGAAASLNYAFVDATNSRACAIVCYVPPGATAGPRVRASFLLFDKRSDTNHQYGISYRSYRDEKRAGWIVEAEVTCDFRYGVVDGSGNITGAYGIFDATV